jgi:hypothetical protein
MDAEVRNLRPTAGRAEGFLLREHVPVIGVRQIEIVDEPFVPSGQAVRYRRENYTSGTNAHLP